MDRNEKQNSHRNTNNTRGMNKKVKKYRSKMIAAICVAAVLLVMVVGLLIGYLRLSKKYEEATGEANGTSVETQDGNVTEYESGTESQTSIEPESDTAAEDETTEEQSDGAVSETTAASGDGQEPAAAETGAEQSEPDAETGTEEIQNTVNMAVADYAGLEYWLVPMTGEAAITNSGIEAEKVIVSEIQDFGKLFVLGKMYDRMQNSVAGTEAGLREVTVSIEGDNENTTDLRPLAEIMMGLREGSAALKEGPMAAADELVARIGESFDSDTEVIEENVTNKETRFEDGLKKIQEFAASIGCSTVTIGGFDAGKDAANVIYLSDCITYFDRLAQDGFGLDEERLIRMKQLLVKTDDKLMAEMAKAAGENSEVLGVAGTSRDNVEYSVILVTQGNKQYVLAAKVPVGLDAGWKAALAQAVFGAVPEKASAETEVPAEQTEAVEILNSTDTGAAAQTDAADAASQTEAADQAGAADVAGQSDAADQEDAADVAGQSEEADQTDAPAAAPENTTKSGNITPLI